MSNTDSAPLGTLESVAASPPRKPWRSPEVIEAERCRRAAAKTTFDAIEIHNSHSTSESS
jgi:hypothetical protein